MCVGLSVVSILPKVQEHMPKSGLLQSAVITLYILYLTWSAMANSPYPVLQSTKVRRFIFFFLHGPCLSF